MQNKIKNDAICGKMDFGHDRIRMNVEADRLSSLPDDVIHKILSSISLREAIGMSILSSRWRFIWTSLPYLNFEDFSSSSQFPKCVSKVLSQRNNQVYSVRLVLGVAFCYESVNRVLNYTFSHNVQHLSGIFNASVSITTPDWDLPALTTLHLDCITLFDNNTDKCIGLVSKCTNLKNLYLRKCTIRGTNVLNIFHSRLSNLTLEDAPRRLEVVNVIAPELKNLSIINCYQKHLISAPGLTSLVMKGLWRPLVIISTEGFFSLEKAELCIDRPVKGEADKIICLLQLLQSVKFLTLNLEILEFLQFLSSSMGVMAHQLSPFANLKILKFIRSRPAMVYLEVQAQEKAITATKIKNYDSSPSAIFRMELCKEIRVMRNIVSAQELVANLQVELKYGKKHFRDTNNARIVRPATAPMLSCKAQVNKQWTQSASQMQLYIEERMPQLKQSESDEFKQRKIEELLTKLQQIEGLVAKLPASKRPAMEATFDIVCEEAANVTSKILDSMKIIEYNEKLKL